MSSIPLVVYDTSVILLQFKEKIPVVDQVVQIVGVHIPLIVDLTIRELNQLIHTREWSTSRAAKLALSILKMFSVYKTDRKFRSADEAIMYVASKLREQGLTVYVATCDQELKHKLERLNIPVITLRTSKRSLVIDWEE